MNKLAMRSLTLLITAMALWIIGLVFLAKLTAVGALVLYYGVHILRLLRSEKVSTYLRKWGILALLGAVLVSGQGCKIPSIYGLGGYSRASVICNNGGAEDKGEMIRNFRGKPVAYMEDFDGHQMTVAPGHEKDIQVQILKGLAAGLCPLDV